MECSVTYCPIPPGVCCSNGHALCIPCLFGIGTKCFREQPGNPPTFVCDQIRVVCPLCRDDYVTTLTSNVLTLQTEDSTEVQCEQGCGVWVENKRQYLHYVNCTKMEGTCPWCDENVNLDHICECPLFDLHGFSSAAAMVRHCLDNGVSFLPESSDPKILLRAEVTEGRQLQIPRSDGTTTWAQPEGSCCFNLDGNGLLLFKMFWPPLGQNVLATRCKVKWVYWSSLQRANPNLASPFEIWRFFDLTVLAPDQISFVLFHLLSLGAKKRNYRVRAPVPRRQDLAASPPARRQRLAQPIPELPSPPRPPASL